MSDAQLLEFVDSVESSVESADESFDSDGNIETDLMEGDVQQKESVQNVGVATALSNIATQEPSTSSTTSPTTKALMKGKRARSPLPTAEVSGPSSPTTKVELGLHCLQLRLVDRQLNLNP
ncbi:hypothetical protein QE152_g35161 [Popillia japonica]|uniref:Uncharacterized protein n=1 Tax=Popillia japonica TaxID=7064 RepID=A0AAW1ISB9_POPJA